jgi:excisionase family DNA binding protein
MVFLTIDEVAQILKMHTNTIYRMCRKGILPAVKIGKEWRIDHQKLAKFMHTGITQTEASQLQELTADALKGGHVLGIFSDNNDIAEFELAFLKAAPREGNQFLKACWWQHPDDVRQYLSEGNMPVDEMEADGSFVIIDLGDVFCRSGPIRAAEQWVIATNEALARGFKGLVGVGSPHFNCCGSHTALMEFETTLDNGLKGLPVAGVCSYLVDNDTPDAFLRLVDLITLHDRFFIKTTDRSVLARNISTFFS